LRELLQADLQSRNRGLDQDASASEWSAAAGTLMHVNGRSAAAN
jgi:hypothetical protein